MGTQISSASPQERYGRMFIEQLLYPTEAPTSA